MGLDHSDKSIFEFLLINKDFFNIASDWLVAVLPANQKPSLNILIN